MAAGDDHALGYHQVDDDEHVDVLLGTMQATAQWEATVELRAWERHGLMLMEGERLLDVGCGRGEAVLALSEDLGVNGEVVGIDRSTSMLEVASGLASGAACSVRFVVGDAMDLSAALRTSCTLDVGFDAIRCERTLQWLSDPQAAVDQMARLLMPGGRLSLIDTDWSTLRLDVGDPGVAAQLRAALRAERGRASNVGSRLGELARAAGLDVRGETSAAHVWSEWNPDASPAPDGCFSMSSLAEDLVAAGELDAVDTERFVSTVHHAARSGNFSMSLTMFAVIAAAPMR